MPGSGHSSASPSGPAKVRRARLACIQCRSRRTRCDADPPHPCQFCLDSALECEWPSSSEIKKRGRKSKHREDSPLRRGSANSQVPAETLDSWWPPPSPPVALGQADSLPQEAIRPSPRYIAGSVDDSRASLDPTPLSRLLEQYDALLPQNTLDMSWLGIYAPDRQATRGVPQDQSALNGSRSFPSFPQDERNRFSLQSRLPQMPDMPRDGTPTRGSTSADVAQMVMPVSRAHGMSAVTPGNVQECLHFRIEPTPDHADVRYHDAETLHHLVNLFFIHYGCLFPALTVAHVRHLVQASPREPPFLILALCSLSAKFTVDPRSPEKRGEARRLGESFRLDALSKLGMVLAIPTWQTILGVICLTWSAMGDGSASEAWALIGLAMRMTYDINLHRLGSTREDRLTFWSALMTEYLICLADGRRPSISPSRVTQQLPDDTDCASEVGPDGSAPLKTPRHPFPFMAKLTNQISPLLEIINDDTVLETQGLSGDTMTRVDQLCAEADEWYGDLHVDVAWNAANLQLHYKAGQGSVYLFLHIFSHSIQSLRFLLDRQHKFVDFAPSGVQVETSPTAFPRWLHSPRFIGDMLVLANLIEPRLYLAMPFTAQCFFFAGKSFLLDKRQREELAASQQSSAEPTTTAHEEKKHNLFLSLTEHNIELFQQALESLSTYWHSAAKIRLAFEQCCATRGQASQWTDDTTRSEVHICLRGLDPVDLSRVRLSPATPDVQHHTVSNGTENNGIIAGNNEGSQHPPISTGFSPVITADHMWSTIFPLTPGGG